MKWDLSPRTIYGDKVQLEPLTNALHEQLCECLLNEPDGWFARMYSFNTPEAVTKMIEGWTKANKERRAMSFVARDRLSMKVAGISQYMRIEEQNRQLEIGGTMVGREFRRTYVNSEMKYLMLKDAFERLSAIRVFFKADTENFQSQNSLIRLGIQCEGVARNDAILPDGRKRDFQIYGITDSEWPSIKSRLSLLNSKF